MSSYLHRRSHPPKANPKRDRLHARRHHIQHRLPARERELQVRGHGEESDAGYGEAEGGDVALLQTMAVEDEVEERDDDDGEGADERGLARAGRLEADGLADVPDRVPYADSYAGPDDAVAAG